jgi:hypothetical protein
MDTERIHINVSVNGKIAKGTYHYSAIGFKDERKIRAGKPYKESWETLLSLASWNGEISYELKNYTTSKKRFQELRDILQEFMGIKGDPFYPYDKRTNSIKARFDISHYKGDHSYQKEEIENSQGQTLPDETDEELEKKYFGRI